MRFLPCAAVFVLLVSGCASAMKPDDLLAKMREGVPPVILDVRSQGEYDRGHVPGAVHVPFYAVIGGAGTLVRSKETPLVLYCEHGPRAGIAGFLLFLAGYDHVQSLEGHMKHWRSSEFPIETVQH